MKYELRVEKAFAKRMDNLSLLLGLTKREEKEAREEILDITNAS